MAMQGLKQGTNAMAAGGELDDEEEEEVEEDVNHPHKKKSVELHLEGVMENYNKHEHALKQSFEHANAEAQQARDPHSGGDAKHQSGHHSATNKEEDAGVPQNPNKKSSYTTSHTPKSMTSSYSAHSGSSNSIPAPVTPGSAYKYNFDAYEDHTEEDAILDQQVQAKKKEKKQHKKDKHHSHGHHHGNSSHSMQSSVSGHSKVAVDYGDDEADYQAVEGGDHEDYNAGVSGLI